MHLFKRLANNFITYTTKIEQQDVAVVQENGNNLTPFSTKPTPSLVTRHGEPKADKQHEAQDFKKNEEEDESQERLFNPSPLSTNFKTKWLLV